MKEAEQVRSVVMGAARVTSSSNARRLAGQAIADGIGVALAGSAEPTVEACRRAVREVDGSGTARVWGTSCGLAVGSAVFANAVAEHSLGWDDYMQPMFGHCTAVLLPVCSALAEQTGASGSQLLDAFLAGYEVDGLLGATLGATHYDRGWHATSTIGTIGAAAAASRLLGLGDEQSWNALGMAASAAAGFQGNFGSTAKSVHAGQAARAGMLAAFLARSGATANPMWLLGPTGYLALMAERDPSEAAKDMLAHRDARADRLVIEGDWGLVLKPYCCCGSAQPMIRALVELVTQEGVAAAEIQAVEVHVDPAVAALLVYDRPATPGEARYCLPYLAAVAVVDRAAGPDQFTDAALGRGMLVDMMSRVRWVADRVAPPDARYRAEVRVTTARGTFERVAEVAEGHPRAPMSTATRWQKFEQGAGSVLPAAQVAELRDRLSDVDGLPVWSDASSLLVPLDPDRMPDDDTTV